MLVNIGKIVDAHGLKGELKIRFISEKPEWADKIKEIYLLSDLQMQTLQTCGFESKESVEKLSRSLYKVQHINVTPQSNILTLEGVVDRNHSEALKHLLVFVKADFFSTHDGESPYLRELLNYSVMLEGHFCGSIIGFLETPAHDLILIENSLGEQFEIPWVSDFIVKIDRQDERVFMKFPESLLSPEFNVKGS